MRRALWWLAGRLFVWWLVYQNWRRRRPAGSAVPGAGEPNGASSG